MYIHICIERERERESEYTRTQTHKHTHTHTYTYTYTYRNVNNASPTSKHVEWLRELNMGEKAHIIVVGLQEVDLKVCTLSTYM